MKYARIIILILVVIQALNCFTFADSEINNGEITVLMNGELIEIGKDSLPFIKDGRTLVPIRSIFEKMGASVEWQGVTNTVYAKKDNFLIELSVGDIRAKSYDGVVIENIGTTDNGVDNKPTTEKEIIIDVPPVNNGGRVFIPLRFIAESFGKQVTWVPDGRNVFISDRKEVPGFKARLDTVRGSFPKQEPLFSDGSGSGEMDYEVNEGLFDGFNGKKIRVIDKVIRVNNLGLETRHKVKEILKLAYPNSYNIAYDWLMKSLREEVALKDGVLFSQAGINLYLDNRYLEVRKLQYTSAEVAIGIYGSERLERSDNLKDMHFNFAPHMYIKKAIEYYQLNVNLIRRKQIEEGIMSDFRGANLF